ncbi:SCO family protein [Flavobacteriaceae bacterium 14752]|uniref:SCO family protein n=1 Tax=Mesohalobacter salilacus TaxID=2491711 RepID=UPI000F63480A|nr:SCO family protein [Flavobacteriaceae bacterium 14752]
MLKFFSRYKFIAVVMFILSIIIITIIYNLYKPEPRLKVYQPNEFTKELVDSSLQRVRKFHHISDFKLINQYGDTISQDNFKDKIYITDFFFTTCQTICPIMTKHMEQIQAAFKNDDEVMLLSHSVTPQIDDVERLKKYAEAHNAIKGKWHLVTGLKKDIYKLARQSYFTTKTTGDGGKYDMIHTENFVLIDKEKRIRGIYDGTNPEEIEQAIKDIKILKQEYAK